MGRPPVEPQIKRFDKPVRKRLRKLVRTGARFGDLLFSFPAAAYAIAAEGRSAAQRAAGVKAVKDGASLQAVAEALELPGWLRKLPPEAFRGALIVPPALVQLGRSVSGLAPEEANAAADWYETVVIVAHGAGEKAAAWVAKQQNWGVDGAMMRAAAFPVAAYVWHSVNQHARARTVIDRFWTKHMTFRRAAAEARAWLETVVHKFCLEESREAQSWGKAQRYCSYHIVPLTTAQELEHEGRAMNNCLATYQHFMERGGCLLFAVRRGSKSVASLELRADPYNPGKASVIQLEGPNNTPAPQRIARAVQGWLGRQGPFPLAPRGGIGSRAVNAKRWAGVWAAYVETVGADGAGPFASAPNAATLRAIAQPLNALEYI